MIATEPCASDVAKDVLDGAYRIVRLLGRGGSGSVFEAIQLRLNKRVAIKIMTRELTFNPLSLARFHREAEIMSKLGHPHLVNVMDFGKTEAGVPYLAMEILDGEDLQRRLERVKRMPLEATARIVGQVASALGAAHDQGIVHRDMKPANIFLLHVPGETEFVKVLDFGIAKMKDARDRLTRNATVLGTPLYMSPELTLGMSSDPDHRADQWALACIAWEMLSGKPPFESENLHVLFHQIKYLEPTPLRGDGLDRAPGVERVLRKALAKRPDERYPSIREFALAFENAARGQSEVPSSTKRSWVASRIPWGRLAAVALGVALFVGLTATARSRRSSVLDGRAMVAAPPVPAVATSVTHEETLISLPSPASKPQAASPVPAVTVSKEISPSKEVKRMRAPKATAITSISSNQPAPQTERKPWIFGDL